MYDIVVGSVLETNVIISKEKTNVVISKREN